VQTEVQKKIQQEIDLVVGKDADVTWEDRPRSVPSKVPANQDGSI